MESIVDFLYQVKDFLNPKFLIDYMLNWLGMYVYFGLWFVIFAETGLAVGFFCRAIRCWSFQAFLRRPES